MLKLLQKIFIMKPTLTLTIFSISSLLLFSCVEDKNKVFDCSYDCKYFLPIDNNSTRSDAKTLKGQILFSWRNDQNGWNYAVVPNLNISRADDRVGENNSISGKECLKENLRYFAEGEEIFWRVEGNLETTSGKTINLAAPSAEIVENLQEYCDEINIELIFL